MAALLASEKVARASQLQIEGRNFEARAQVGKFFQSGQAAARDGSQLDLGRQQEIRVSSAIRPAHPAAQLVELGEPQAIGAVDENGVAQRNIQSVLNDGCGYQDV